MDNKVDKIGDKVNKGSNKVGETKDKTMVREINKEPKDGIANSREANKDGEDNKDSKDNKDNKAGEDNKEVNNKDGETNKKNGDCFREMIF